MQRLAGVWGVKDEVEDEERDALTRSVGCAHLTF